MNLISVPWILLNVADLNQVIYEWSADRNLNLEWINMNLSTSLLLLELQAIKI